MSTQSDLPTNGNTPDVQAEVSSAVPEVPHSHGQQHEDVRGRRPLVFCGMCGALNPATSFYCAACGTTLVDAFHATEGLRVFEQADSASRLIEIVPSGTELELVEDTNAPEDFIRVRLEYGRLGYIRLQDVAAMADASNVASGPVSAADLDINTNARGCVSSTGALAAIALAIILGVLMMIIISRANIYDQGTLAIVFCVVIGPLLLGTIALFLYARGREERMDAIEEDREESGKSKV